MELSDFSTGNSCLSLVFHRKRITASAVEIHFTAGSQGDRPVAAVCDSQPAIDGYRAIIIVSSSQLCLAAVFYGNTCIF